MSSGAAGARRAEGTGKRSLPAVPWNERLALAGDATCNNEVNPAQAERPRSEARRKHDWRVADESLRIGVHQEIGGNGKNSEDNDNAKATRP